MIKKRYYSLLFVAFMSFTGLQEVHCQEWSLNPGVFYNGGLLQQRVYGAGLIAGIEYKPSRDHVYSIELRTKYAYYGFDDGTKWWEDADGNLIPPVNLDEARVEYELFSPQVSLVPKFYLRFDKPFSLFLEGEHGVGLMTGKFLFKGFDDKKTITETFFTYSAGVGIEYDDGDWVVIGSIGYSNLNFRNNIKKHLPAGYQEWLPNQNAPFYINLIFKIPLNSRWK